MPILLSKAPVRSQRSLISRCMTTPSFVCQHIWGIGFWSTEPRLESWSWCSSCVKLVESALGMNQPICLSLINVPSQYNKAIVRQAWVVGQTHFYSRDRWLFWRGTDPSSQNLPALKQACWICSRWKVYDVAGTHMCRSVMQWRTMSSNSKIPAKKRPSFWPLACY